MNTCCQPKQRVAVIWIQAVIMCFYTYRPANMKQRCLAPLRIWAKLRVKRGLVQVTMSVVLALYYLSASSVQALPIPSIEPRESSSCNDLHHCMSILDSDWMTHPTEINRQNDLEHHLELSRHYFRMHLGSCPPQHPRPRRKMAHGCFTACGNHDFGTDCAGAGHHVGHEAAGKRPQISRAIQRCVHYKVEIQNGL